MHHWNCRVTNNLEERDYSKKNYIVGGREYLFIFIVKLKVSFTARLNFTPIKFNSNTSAVSYVILLFRIGRI